jgi:hypothetical protein
VTASRNEAWADEEPEPVRWGHGPWSLEVRGDELARIAFDGSRLLRSVRSVARDRDWNTVPTIVDGMELHGPTLILRLRHAGLGADLAGTLTCSASGDALRIELVLEAHAEFARNRLGLVALHPPDAAGARLVIGHPDGTSTTTRFPTHIAPHQPALDIERLHWSADGVDVELAFAGDVFEMEDQRNWTDGSFKTYSTPLSAPFPVHVPAGAVVRQSMELRARRLGAGTAPAPAGPVLLEPTGSLVPAFGVGATTAPDPVHAVPGAFVLVELPLGTPVWRDALRRAVEEASGRPLEAWLVGDDPADIPDAVAELVGTGAPFERIGAFSRRSHFSERPLVDALAAALAPTPLAATTLVGGARSHFTELNRGWGLLPDRVEAIAFASTPQMHATEIAQLIASVPVQRLTALEAVRRAGGRSVHVGPVTLRQRFGTVATTSPPAEPGTASGGYGPHLDPLWTDSRQTAPAIAAWTVASAAAFSVPGVATVAYFEQSGPRGVHGTPTERALTWLIALSGTPLWAPAVAPTDVWIIAGGRDGHTVLAANLRSTPVEFELRRPGVRSGITLAPYATRRIEL